MTGERVPGPILPHGGALIERLLTEEEAKAAATRAAGLGRVELSRRERCDLELLAVGAPRVAVDSTLP